MALYAIGGILFSLARYHWILLVIARFLQGIAVSGIELFLKALLPALRGPCFISVAQAMGSAIGPVVGVLISEQLGWEWMKRTSVLIVIVVAACMHFSIAPLPNSESVQGGRPSSWLNGPVDRIGLLLYCSSLAALVAALSCAEHLASWHSWMVLTPLALGVVLLYLFWVFEKQQERPLIPLPIFSDVRIVEAYVSVFGQGFVQDTMLAYQPLFLKTVSHQPLWEAAQSMFRSVTAFAVSRGLVRFLPRKNLTLAIRFSWIGAAVASLLWYVGGPNWIIQVALGGGLSCIFNTTRFLNMGADPPAVAAAKEIFPILQLLGSLTGSTLSSVIFGFTLRINPSKDLSQAESFKSGKFKALEPLELTKIQVEGLYQEAFYTIWKIMAGFACLGFLGSSFGWIKGRVQAWWV
ncbi:hypothetical protein GGR53DRAFT_150683 [Hypoxylon sp. FL1150]|nr:hypothetical protein GGR53DRAFT_150683 [Hypoxylon sp. FL1150]